MSKRLINNRETNEIPPEIQERSDLYPNPEAYTYKVHIINEKRHISLFPVLIEEEIRRREHNFNNCLSQILKKHPETIKRLKQNEYENKN